MVAEDWIDVDGYPTEEALEKLRRWSPRDVNGALAFMAALWWPDGYGVSRTLSPAEWEIVHAEPGDEFYRFATGGWSGNEDLISAFRGHGGNKMDAVDGAVRGRAWCLSASGGLHIFRCDREERHG